MKRLALIEDDQLLLKRMTVFLNSQASMECVLSANSLGMFFENLPENPQIDLLLIDIELSNTINTIDHLQKVRNLLPNTRILVITGHNHPDYILTALQKGANSFYLKGSGLNKLLEAIETTIAGGTYLTPEAAAHMIPFFNAQQDRPFLHSNKNAKNPSHAVPCFSKSIKLDLSPREKDVAWRLVDGYSYQEIASELLVSLNTVRHYVKVLYKRFGVSNKVQLGKKIKSYL